MILIQPGIKSATFGSNRISSFTLLCFTIGSLCLGLAHSGCVTGTAVAKISAENSRRKNNLETRQFVKSETSKDPYKEAYIHFGNTIEITQSFIKLSCQQQGEIVKETVREIETHEGYESLEIDEGGSLLLADALCIAAWPLYIFYGPMAMGMDADDYGHGNWHTSKIKRIRTEIERNTTIDQEFTPIEGALMAQSGSQEIIVELTETAITLPKAIFYPIDSVRRPIVVPIQIEGFSPSQIQINPKYLLSSEVYELILSIENEEILPDDASRQSLSSNIKPGMLSQELLNLLN